MNLRKITVVAGVLVLTAGVVAFVTLKGAGQPPESNAVAVAGTESVHRPGVSTGLDAASGLNVREPVKHHYVKSESTNSRVLKIPHRRSTPEPLPPGNVAEHFDQLKTAALSGDTKISYALAAALFRCGYITDYESPQCSGLSEKQINQYPQFLDIAASHGNLNAQINYPTLMGVYMQRSDMAFDPDAIRKYKQKSLMYLHEAASKGSIDALTQLSMTYADGYLVDKNMETAYAYTYAVYETGLAPLSGRLLQKWQGSLSYEQLADAKRRGLHIYARCCVN